MASAQALMRSCQLRLAGDQATGMEKDRGALLSTSLTGWKLGFQCK